MRLWRVHIKTYYFGIRYYDLFVLANTESNMLRTVYDYLAYRKDEDAEVVNYEEVNLNDFENRVLWIKFAHHQPDITMVSIVDACYEIILKLHELKLL